MVFTDKKIDALVYELYGLSEDEMKIVGRRWATLRLHLPGLKIWIAYNYLSRLEYGRQNAHILALKAIADENKYTVKRPL